MTLTAAASSHGEQIIVFREVAEEAGVTFDECRTDSLINQMWGAPSWGDYDNDGDWDLAVSNLGHNRLFRNEGNGRFVDVTRQAGLWDDVGMGMQMSFADFDNDGDQDIYLTNMMSFNILYRNDGDGAFTDISGSAGVKLPAGGASGYAVGDYNGDGFLDLYVTSYTLGPWGILFRNNGDMTFRDVTEPAGVDNSGMEMTALWLDYDNDGDFDLYQVNDIRGHNKLFRNNGNGTFTDVSAVSGADDAGSGMGATFGDINNDGFLDLFITNFVYDSPLLASGDGTFQNIADRFLIRETLLERITILDEDTDVNWAAIMFDADNDGDLDIFSSSGSVMGPTVYPNYFWLNEGDNNFRNISKELGLEDYEGTARGAAVCDYDGDGDLDLYVVNINEAPNRLYRNETPRQFNWLDVKLQGVTSNRDAIGARVYLYAGEMFQMRDLVCGNNYQSDNYRQVHFGLNNKTRVDSLVVRWPSGFQNVVTDIEPNRVVTLVEKENDQGPAPRISQLAQNQPNPFVMTGTTIRFELSKPGQVSLKIYNILGQEVRTLVDEFKPVGRHAVRWDATGNDGRKLASGLYFYRILSGDYSATRRMVYIR